MEKFTQPAFVAGIVGSVKLVLDGFGVHIPDATVNDFVNGAAAVVTIIGIFKDHGRQLKPPERPITTTVQPPAQP